MTTTTEGREVWQWPGGVRCYPPTRPDGYYRITWRDAGGKRRETTASTDVDAAEKAELLSKAASSGAVRSTGTFGELLAAYEAQVVPDQAPNDAASSRTTLARARRYPQLIGTPCARLTPGSFGALFRDARTDLAYSSRQTLRRRLLHVINWGRREDWIPADRDPLAKVDVGRPDTRVHGDGQWAPVRDDEIPTHDAVHAVAKEMATTSGHWWGELMVLLAAYSGLRWGELIALTGADIVWPDDPSPDIQSTIRVRRQVIEVDGAQSVTAPKGNKVRVAFWPPTTPGGVDLEAMLRRRVAEVDDGLLFPPARGNGFLRRSNHNRRWWTPARDATAGWAGWTWHDLRHVYCTWLLSDLGMTPPDCIVFTGHSTTTVFHARYVGTRPKGAAAAALARLTSGP